MSKGPVIFEADTLSEAAHGPNEAPPLPDPVPEEGAAARAIRVAGRRRSPLARLVGWAFGALLLLWVGAAAADFVTGLWARSDWLGSLAGVLLAIVALGLILFVLREVAGLARLARVEGLQARARAGLAGDRGEAQALAKELGRLYAGRAELRLGLEKLRRAREETLDGDVLVHAAEREICAPLDALAEREVEAASRRVAAATALVPLALADMIVALLANISMIRAVAEIYGGRAGLFGSLRLLRAVAAHLVATGAVAVGDDMLGSALGGGVLSKLSRRFGEGVVNGALTARVGIAAIEVCRPIPFTMRARPGVSGLVKRALTGLFSGG